MYVYILYVYYLYYKVYTLCNTNRTLYDEVTKENCYSFFFLVGRILARKTKIHDAPGGGHVHLINIR